MVVDTDTLAPGPQELIERTAGEHGQLNWHFLVNSVVKANRQRFYSNDSALH